MCVSIRIHLACLLTTQIPLESLLISILCMYANVKLIYILTNKLASAIVHFAIILDFKSLVLLYRDLTI